jgi:hypothetical protein
MRTTLSTNREQGLTLVELFVVIAIITFLAIVFVLPANSRSKGNTFRIQCVNNLKQTGLAFRVWEGDHGGEYPMRVSETNGGTLEFTTGLTEWRHFQIMSNELSTPKVLLCPADASRMAATNFTFLRNSNISFFVGIDATETNPQMLLAGDRNITNSRPIKNAILETSTNSPAGWTPNMHDEAGNLLRSDGSVWTSEMHQKVGNILLSDGSVQQLTITGLRAAIENTGLATNRLQMPILDP